jgi:hypothetical protein
VNVGDIAHINDGSIDRLDWQIIKGGDRVR